MRRRSTGDGGGRTAPPRPLALVTALAFGTLSASFAMTALLPIQAELPQLLDAGRGDTAWVITATLLSSAVITPIAGKLGDMYGKRRIIVVLLVLQVIGSVVCGLSNDVVSMIVGRALQGITMGVIPIGIAIMRDVLPPQRLGVSVGIMSATLGIGGAIGLPLGGFVTHAFDWHTLFWLSAAIALIGIWLVLALVPLSGVRAPGRLDIVGAIGMAIGVSLILVALTRGNEWGWLSAPTLTLLLAGIAVLIIWGWWELRVDNPVADLRVAARAPVMLTNLTSAMLAFGLYSSNIAYPQLLEIPTASGHGLGLDLFTVGLVMLPHAVAITVFSPIGGRLLGIFGPRMMLVASGGITAIGFLISLVLPLDAWTVLIILTIFGAAAGLGYASMPVIIMRAVPVTETGAANGLNALMRSTGNTVAAAAVGAVLANAVMDVDGVPVPTHSAFQTSFVIGLVAAVAAVALALAIPRAYSRPIPDPAREAMNSPRA